MRLAFAAVVALAALPLRAQDSDRDKKLQEKVDALGVKVGETLGVPLRNKVPAAYQSREDFGKKVKSELDKEYPPEKTRALQRYYQLLGLAGDDFDFTQIVIQTMQSQAGAYYDPETKKMYVLAGDMPDSMLDGILFHELVHAVQDQEHGLEKKMKALSEGKNDDAANGFRFLVEGEASFWMQAYMIKSMTGQDMDALPAAVLDMAMGMTKNTTTKSIIQQLDAQAALLGATTPSLKESADQIKKAPPIIVRTLVEPYMRGLYYSYKFHRERGKDGFRTLMKEGGGWNTRDMMFADAFVKSPRGTASVVLADLSPGAGWTKTLEDTAGALTLHIAFEDQLPQADAVARGWDGDRVQVWQKGDEAFLAGVFAFDTDAAASTFVKQVERLYREQWTKGAKIEEKDGLLVAGGKDHFLAEAKGRKAVFARGAAAVSGLKEKLWKAEVGEVKLPAGARKDF